MTEEMGGEDGSCGVEIELRNIGEFVLFMCGDNTLLIWLRRVLVAGVRMGTWHEIPI